MNRVVKEIEKRKNVVIRICRVVLGGYEYVEIRQFVADKHGEYIPTKKGLTFNPKHLDEFIEGLVELKKTFTQKI